MAEKDQQVHSMAPAAQAPAKGDVESATAQSNELRKKKRIKCLAYVAAFAVFQTMIILVFSLTVMRIKSPKYRLRSVLVEDLTYSSSATSPSFNMKFNAEVHVKNTNFGHYKFENSTIIFTYGGVPVGQASVNKARARARSTKKMNVTVDVSSNNIDINSGFVTLSSHSGLSGKVQLMKVIKKKKSAEMNCIMIINLANKAVQDLNCK